MVYNYSDTVTLPLKGSTITFLAMAELAAKKRIGYVKDYLNLPVARITGVKFPTKSQHSFPFAFLKPS